MSGSKPNSKSHIPSLDGIRALSIAVVFVAHAGLSHIVPGGFGVTVFFFLSGFLITTLLRREYDKTGGIHFKNFYIRRALRILPPFYAVLGIAILLERAGLLRSESSWLGVGLLAAHVGNYAQIFWHDEAFPAGTGVFWSLAVEEHFYFVFPALALFLLRLKNRSLSLLTLSALAVGIMVWRFYLVSEGVSESRTYYATDTRFDSILFGCILALGRNPVMDPPFRVTPLVEKLSLVASASVLLFCFVYRDPAFRETYRYTLQGLALMPLFYLAVHRAHWPLFSWLEFAPLKYLGLLSYTLYLVHFIVLALLEERGLPTLLVGILAAFISVGVAALSYQFLEKPLAGLRRRFR